MDEQDKIELNEALQNYSIRKLFYDMLKHCGAFSQNIDSDPHITYFYLGRRNVGLWFMKEIEQVDEKWLLVMMREASERKKIEERKQENDAREYNSD